MMPRAASVIGCVAVLVAHAGCSNKESKPSQPTPAIEAGPPSYVGTETCASCHEAAHEAWLGSHHDLAMQPATEATVLGDFDGASAAYYDEEARFEKRGESFVVSALGPDGKLGTFPVRYTFGAAPLQQYLVELEPGRLQAFAFAWDTRPKPEGGQRWFHLQPEEYIAPGDPLHWTGLLYNWNNNCADCHSTRLIKGYERETRRYDTSYAEVSVGCEACHGPGSRHVKDAKLGVLSDGAGLETKLPNANTRQWSFVPGRDIAVLTTPPETDELETCAPCHSRRADLGDDRAGYHNRYRMATLDGDLYFDDGQIRDEVYVYGSFLQSKMYQAGVICSDCHEPHTAKLRAQGNELCTRC
ncbi:MAG: cytochrome c3 family protein, partial [Myxococcota bacterium]